MINVISCDIYLSSTINVFPYYMKFVNYFRAVCLIPDLLHIVLTFKIQNGK